MLGTSRTAPWFPGAVRPQKVEDHVGAYILAQPDGLVDEDLVRARFSGCVGGVHVHDGAPSADLRRLDGHPDEARLLVKRRRRVDGLAPTFEPGPSGKNPAGRLVAHGDLDRATQEAADAAAAVTMQGSFARRLEVHPIAAHQPGCLRIEVDRVGELQHAAVERGGPIPVQLET